METELSEMSQCVHTRTLEVIVQSATFLDTHTHVYFMKVVRYIQNMNNYGGSAESIEASSSALTRESKEIVKLAAFDRNRYKVVFAEALVRIRSVSLVHNVGMPTYVQMCMRLRVWDLH